MSRRRSTDPAIPVSIAIPRSLHTRLNEILAYKSSRSAWVVDAIKLKLNEQSALDSIDVNDILLHLYDRLPRKDHYRTLRTLYIDGPTQQATPAEETAAKQ